MSLDYNLSGIEGGKTLCFDDSGALSRVTESIIFTTLPAGIGKLTKRNVDTFIARSRVLAYVYNYAPLDESAVRKHVGLITNVPALTSAQFKRRMQSGLWERIPHALRTGV